MAKPPLRRLLSLSFRIGNLTFGGGDPTMAVFQRELVTRRGWLSPEEYGLAFGLARITPGTNLLAFCAAAGWRLRGWQGALTVVLAVTLPSAVLAVVLTSSYQQLRAQPVATAAINGMVAAAVGMMAAGAWLLLRPRLGRKTWPRSAVLFGGCVALTLVFSVPPIQVLALAALAGWVWRGPERP